MSKQYTFRVGFAKGVNTRLGLMDWLKEKVGDLTSADMQAQRYTGEGWVMEAELSTYWDDWMDSEVTSHIRCYRVTLTDSTLALMFKLSWARAVEI